MMRLLIAVAVLVSAALPAAAQTKLSVGYIATADTLAIVVAKERGFFDRRGLDVTPVRIALASNVPSAIMSDSVQIGMGTGPMLLQTADAGLNLVVVGGIARINRQSNIVSLVARSGLKVDGPADLRGKRIGVPGFNSMFHVFLQKWLLDRGIQPKEVNMVEAAFPQMNDQLKGGSLDAVLVLEPFRNRILGGGVGYKVADFVNDVNPDVLAAYWMTKADWAASNAQTLNAFREAYAEGIAWALQNQDAMRGMETKLLGGPSPVIPAYTIDAKPADFEVFDRIGRDLGMWRSNFDLNKLVLTR
jgi:NitT/TauT family transport system substrate-binding protein